MSRLLRERLLAGGVVIDIQECAALLQGGVLPLEAEAFLDALTKTFDLGVETWTRLTEQLAFDIVQQEMGAELAAVVFPRLAVGRQP